VAVSFVTGACKLHGIPDPYADDKLIGIWNFVEHVVDDQDAFWKALATESFWANLDWMPDGKELLAVAEDYFGKENICLLTSGEVDGSADGKRTWVKKYMPDYSKRLMVGTAKKFCAHRGSVLIDDADHNINAFVEAGGHGILVPRIWNSGHEDRHRSVDMVEKHLEWLFEMTI